MMSIIITSTTKSLLGGVSLLSASKCTLYRDPNTSRKTMAQTLHSQNTTVFPSDCGGLHLINHFSLVTHIHRLFSATVVISGHNKETTIWMNHICNIIHIKQQFCRGRNLINYLWVLAARHLTVKITCIYCRNSIIKVGNVSLSAVNCIFKSS